MIGRRVLPLVAAAALLTGCVQVALGSDELACRSDDEGEAATGVVLMAQAVDSAAFVPCLDTIPLGWHLSDVEIRDGSGRFWLDSDRDGVRAIEVVLTGGCDVRKATEIPSDRDGVRRYELVTRISPDYAGTRYYVFDGGCLAVHFRLAGHDRAEPLAVATEGVDFVAREDVEEQVRAESGGRLELDPTAPGDGVP